MLHPISSNPATIRVTVDDFSRYIASKRDFYVAMLANGYYLPNYKSTMITEDYMRDIVGGRKLLPALQRLQAAAVRQAADRRAAAQDVPPHLRKPQPPNH